LADLLGLKEQFSERILQGFYRGEAIVVSGIGYELYWDGKRVGHEPAWNGAAAVGNFRWNTERHPNLEVVALHHGTLLTYLESVTVLPVFFIPQDQAAPTQSERDLLRRHLEIAQTRYRQMLCDRDTFSLSKRLLEYRSPHPLEYYRNEADRGASKYLQEVMAKLDVNGFNCPYVLVVILINPHELYPLGGGRPINGNVGLGGGLVMMSSFALNRNTNFQSTLQHELGHSFGLIHVKNYGYSMQTNDSIMSYNLGHHWKGFDPPQNQGILIPEDIRTLAKHAVAFPYLSFDPKVDVPAGYDLK